MPATALTLNGGPTVFRLGYGAMRITGRGIWGALRDESAALALLRRVVEKGVDFIDTADSYGPEVSEILIAKALAPYPAGVGDRNQRRAHPPRPRP
jgi:pyridoxine 4-dehydrogenase